MTREELKDIINHDLDPDKVRKMPLNDLKDFLINKGIIKTEADLNLVIIEKIQDVYKKDDEFPIHYYVDDKEQIPDENRVVDDDTESLTDDYIETHLS